jgi:hypothetical protein
MMDRSTRRRLRLVEALSEPLRPRMRALPAKSVAVTMVCTIRQYVDPQTDSGVGGATPDYQRSLLSANSLSSLRDRTTSDDWTVAPERSTAVFTKFPSSDGPLLKGTDAP